MGVDTYRSQRSEFRHAASYRPRATNPPTSPRNKRAERLREAELKLIATFGIRRDSLPAGALREIERLANAQARPGEVSFRFGLPAGSSAAERVAAILHRCGKRAWDHGSPRDVQAEYEFFLLREFEAGDLERAELYWLDPLPTVKPLRVSRYEDGLPVVDRACPREVQCIEAFRHWIVLGDDIKAALEADGALVNADLKRLQTRKPGTLAGWELGSSRDLPPMSTSMRWRDRQNGEWLSEYRPGAIPSEHPTRPALLRYRRSEVDAFGAFDVARTFESFSRALDAHEYAWVVSKRFWRSFVRHGFEGRFIPVVLEEA